MQGKEVPAESYVERDGRLFRVVTLPPALPPKRRSTKTRFHMEDVGKAGMLSKRRRKRRGKGGTKE